MRSFSENALSNKTTQRSNTLVLCNKGHLMKIDTALYNNEKRLRLEGYFIVDMILSLSHQ
jgi:hypothetical protein